MADHKRWFNEQPVAFNTDAQADMIERLRAALASWLGEHTPQTMADHIDEDIRLYGDPNASNLDILYLRRNALRELQPGDLGRYE